MKCIVCGGEVKEKGMAFLEVNFGVCEDCLLTDEEIVDIMLEHNKATMFQAGYEKFGLIKKYLVAQVEKVLGRENARDKHINTEQ